MTSATTSRIMITQRAKFRKFGFIFVPAIGCSAFCFRYTSQGYSLHPSQSCGCLRPLRRHGQPQCQESVFSPLFDSPPAGRTIRAEESHAFVLNEAFRLAIVPPDMISKRLAPDERTGFELVLTLDKQRGVAAWNHRSKAGDWRIRIRNRLRQRLLIPPARDRAAPRGRAQARRRGQAAAAPRRRPLARTSRSTRTSSAAVQRTAPP